MTFKLSHLSRMDKAQRETMLSDLVAMAHKTRATSRAKELAARHGVDVYIFPTKRGLMLDIARPTVQAYVRVSPSGETTEVSSGQ